MRTHILSIEEAQNYLGSQPQNPAGNRPNLQAAQAVVRLAIQQNLTPRQRECVQSYFFEGLTMEQVGEKLGIGKSTVYKHLQKAAGRIRRALQYAQALQEQARLP